MDKGRGDLCCTTVSTDLWTIDLPRPHYHKILLDTGDCRFASSISRTRGFEFFLLPSIVHARPNAMLRERKPLESV